jgi:2-aminoadipate transaminase
MERRKELLHWAVQNQVLIVEDDPYGELYFDAPPPESLYSLAQKTPGADELVIYLSTVSKTIAPGLRVGWAVLPLEMVEPVTRVKQAADIHTSALTQEIVATYLELGLQEDHLGTIRDHYREKCILLSKEIRKKLGHEIDINQPQGGLFLWARLKRDFDSRELLAVAKGEGVIFMPGSAFGAGDDLKRYMRISFANIPNDKIPLAVDRLKLAIETMVHRQEVRSLSLEI